MSVLSVIIACVSLTGALSILRIHDQQTEMILEKKEIELRESMDELKDDTRKAMLELGFNVLILPEDQDLKEWYEKGYSTRYMPEGYVHQLAESGIVIVRHFLPTLQEKIVWPERERHIILVGIRGEVPNLNKPSRDPMVEPIPRGAITLGYELHQHHGIKPGEKVLLVGKEFVVHECRKQLGNQDDISAWIHLDEAQEMLNRKGVINAILALQCVCVDGVELSDLRSEIQKALPGTQVIEKGSLVLARQEARKNVEIKARASLEAEKQKRDEMRVAREGFASILIPVIFLTCGIWIGIMGYTNGRQRMVEIGILRAFGVSVHKVLQVFLIKYLVIGLIGGVIGFAGGMFTACLLEGDYHWASGEGVFVMELMVLSVVGSSALAILAGWLPAFSATQTDPAKILNEQ